jgi:predicted MFS family arabinose efflux permease
VFGVAGFVGNLIATRLVRSLKPFRTSLLAMLSMLLGFGLWTFGAGTFAVMCTGVAFWGLGFASINSMQQARLVEAAPALSSASVALNTSAIYIGQAIGSAVGGMLLAQDMPGSIGYLAIGFMVAGLVLLALTRPRPLPESGGRPAARGAAL